MLTASLLGRDTNPLAYRDLDIPGWPNLDPATVVMALNDLADQTGVPLSQEVVDKVLAVQTLLVNPAAYSDAYLFEKTAEALNGIGPQIGYFPVPLAAAQLALAVRVMHKLRPREEWGVSVRRYCRDVLRLLGIMSFPPSMACLVFDDPHDFLKVDLTDEQKAIQKQRHDDIEAYVGERLGHD